MSFLTFSFVVLFSILITYSLGQLRTYAEEMPTKEKLTAVLENKGENSKVYDRNSTLLYTFKDPNRDREYVEYSQIPPVVIAATIGAEDKDFFIHEGIDYLGTIRGLATTIGSKGDKKIGGSTVTQQLVKQTILSSEQTIDRKIKEALITLMVENNYSKEQILEYYLNAINLGGRITGIKTGAKTYFNKELSQLTLSDATFLIALVQSPGEYSPLYAIDRAKAEKLVIKRQTEIYEQIIANPKIIAYLNSNQRSYLELKEGTAEVDLTAGVATPQYTVETIKALENQKIVLTQPKEQLLAPHWVFYIRGLLSYQPYNLSLKDLYSGGYQIYTTLDLNVQNLAQQKIKEGVDRYGNRYNFANAAAVTIDARTGDILAMIGSKGYDLPNNPNDKKFDPEVNVTVSEQSLGSSLKPWVAYLGFESGKFKENTIVKDSPQVFYKYYKPKDFDGKFMGDMTVRKALLDSRNLPFIKMLYTLGDRKLGEFMTKVGYNTTNNYGLSSAVGGVNESLLAHTGAYTGLANGGQVMQRRAVLKITKADGSTYYESQPSVLYQLNSKNAATVNDILGDKGYTPGNYKSKFIGNQKLAGKTGTSDGNKDTFYLGYGPKVVTGVWCGNNDNSRMTSSALGSSTALLVWNGYMREFFRQFPQYGESGSY